jgi:hypothetical protein
MHEDKKKLYLISLSSSLSVSVVLALMEHFLSPWSYFPETSFYIDLYLVRYDLHLYDLFFTLPLYLSGSLWVYLWSGKLAENLVEGISNLMLSMVTEDLLYFLLEGRLPSPLEDSTTMIVGCISLNCSCMPIWWILYFLPTIYVLISFLRRVSY